jgi:hypothetical protein
MTTESHPPRRLPPPAETLVVGPDGRVLVAVDGALVLPLGTRIELETGGDAAVVGIRVVGLGAGALQLVLEVDAGGASFDTAALEEAEAEAEVVEAAELITATPPGPLAEEPTIAPPPA